MDMKNIVISFLGLFLLISLSARAEEQATVDIADVINALTGTVLIPVMVDFSETTDSEGVCGFDFTISFDETVLTMFNGVTSLHPDIAEKATITFGVEDVGATDGEILISFADNTANLETKDILFEMEFEYAGGFSLLTFVDVGLEGVTEVGVCTDTVEQIPTLFIDGSISPLPVPVNNWAIFLSLGLIISFSLLGMRKIF